jgi:hypothetical protein
MHMADQDDDDEDLKQLKQLRQIWLAMPEEEPPTRGLDALMAAARTQAAAMEPKPSWWKRMLAQLVRPPALALATIVVVAGGAVLVNRHHDDLDATRTQESTATPLAAPPSATPPAPPSAAGSAAPVAPRDEGIVSGGEGKAETQHAPAVEPRVVDKAPVATTKPPAQVVRPAPAKKPAPAHEDPSSFEPRQQMVEGNDVEVATPKDIVLSQRPKPDPTPAPTTPAPRPPPPPAHAASAPSGSVTKVGGAQLATDSVDTKQAESVDSLMRRARDAASRGDCAAAKALAAQIGKLDVGYYRATVLKDAAIVKCL